MRLALFDLDHTLIPFDSGLAWTRFLTARGALPAEAEDRYLAYCHQYVAGTLDIHAMYRAGMLPLARHPRPLLEVWAREFEATMAPSIPADMRALVQQHQLAGDLCAVVTATERLVAEPFARLFGIAHLVATEGVMHEGHYTGAIAGEPCFRAHKVTRVEQWLAQLMPAGAGLAAFDASWFYSDSISDLPLLQAVSHPVAVRPDARLRAHAGQQGWPVVEHPSAPAVPSGYFDCR